MSGWQARRGVALNERVVIAAVGPTCAAILRSYGVRVHVMPDHPKMGPLVLSLMRYLELRTRPHDISVRQSPSTTH